MISPCWLIWFCQQKLTVNKSSHFIGQPIFSQLLAFVDRQDIHRIAEKTGSDHYYKYFKTWEHLVTMLYACLTNCQTLRELSTGLLACEGRLNHLGMDYAPKRSTISDGNKNRSSEVFKQIYTCLYDRYGKTLSDSPGSAGLPKSLFLADSTTISLFKEILKTSGRKRLDGKQKGGIKAHTVMPADSYVANFIHFTSAATHDKCLLDELNLDAGDMICFDKAYIDYKRFYAWSQRDVFMITRMKDNAVFESQEELDIPDECDDGVLKDEIVRVDTQDEHGTDQKLKLRRVAYWDSKKEKVYVFISNNLELKAETIAMIYKRRWYIETFFRKLKQNFPLKYFLGDNQNAIEIQIWVAHIAMLLMQLVKKTVKRKWAFSNLVSMVRFHIMNYIDLIKFLNNPEKAWTEKNKETKLQLELFKSGP